MPIPFVMAIVLKSRCIYFFTPGIPNNLESFWLWLSFLPTDFNLGRIIISSLESISMSRGADDSWNSIQHEIHEFSGNNNSLRT